MTAPTLTVLMPVFNAERHIAAAIDSVLAQTYRDFELLIVDDGSSDRSTEIAAGYSDERIRLVRLGRNHGLSAALNRGLGEARAELVARQDADDVSDPRRFERQVETLARLPELALVGSQARAIDDRGRPLAPVNRSVDEVSIRWSALFDNPFIHSSVMFRRRVIWDELGGFDATFDPYSQDYALWWRVMERYRVGNLAERLITYRVSPSSIIGAVNAAGPSDAYRTRFEAVVETLVVRHIRTFFGVETIDDRDASLMAGFILGIDASSLDRFLSVFEALLKRFQQRHHEWRMSVDFRRTLARQIDAIAYRVRPPSRGSAIRAYVAGIRATPSILGHVPWSRAAASCVLGAAGRARLARLRYGIPLALAC